MKKIIVSPFPKDGFCIYSAHSQFAVKVLLHYISPLPSLPPYLNLLLVRENELPGMCAPRDGSTPWDAGGLSSQYGARSVTPNNFSP